MTDRATEFIQPEDIWGVEVFSGPLNDLAKEVYENAKNHGFWDKERNFGEMMMLAVSELSEALEEDRAGRPDVWFKHTPDCAVSRRKRPFLLRWLRGAKGAETEHINGEGNCTCIPKPEGTIVELADCIIRCLDTMRSRNVDIDWIVELKMQYNASRPYRHGKKY